MEWAIFFIRSILTERIDDLEVRMQQVTYKLTYLTNEIDECKLYAAGLKMNKIWMILCSCSEFTVWHMRKLSWVPGTMYPHACAEAFQVGRHSWYLSTCFCSVINDCSQTWYITMGKKEVEILMGEVKKHNSKLQDLEHKVTVMLEKRMRGYDDMMVAMTSLENNMNILMSTMQCLDTRLAWLEQRSHTTQMLDKLHVFVETMQGYGTRLAKLEQWRSVTDAAMVDPMPGPIFGPCGEKYE